MLLYSYDKSVIDFLFNLFFPHPDMPELFYPAYWLACFDSMTLCRQLILYWMQTQQRQRFNFHFNIARFSKPNPLPLPSRLGVYAVSIGFSHPTFPEVSLRVVYFPNLLPSAIRLPCCPSDGHKTPGETFIKNSLGRPRPHPRKVAFSLNS